MGKTKELLIEIMRGDEELGLYEDITETDNQMYTENDLRDAYNYGIFAVPYGKTFDDWFKERKK